MQARVLGCSNNRNATRQISREEENEWAASMRNLNLPAAIKDVCSEINAMCSVQSKSNICKHKPNAVCGLKVVIMSTVTEIKLTVWNPYQTCLNNDLQMVLQVIKPTNY